MNNLDDIITPTFNWLKEKNKVAIATVISTWGSAPRQVGGQMAINETGEIIGSVSGGCVENSVITEALDSLKDKKHRIKDYGITNDLAWEVGLACGGNLKIYNPTVRVASFLPNNIAIINTARGCKVIGTG